MHRRDLLVRGAALFAAATIASAAPAGKQPPAPPPKGKTPPGLGKHAPVALTFKPGAPLLVLDMYEHAYAIDYGADHAAYIDAFFKNIAWDAVEARYDRAMKAIALLG